MHACLAQSVSLLFIIFIQYQISCVQTGKENLADAVQGCEQAKENDLILDC
jgi:hypothetical protein